MNEPQPIDLDRWRLGYALETAWSAFARPGEKARYHQIAADEQQRRWQYIEMVAQLWQQLSAGELLAYGWRVSPSESKSPVLIPAAMFDSPPNKIDLDIGRFRFHSWCFDSVKVMLPESAAFVDSPALPPSAELPVLRTRRGPKPMGPLVVAAIANLRATDPLFDGRSQEKRIFAIQDEVAAQNPARFPNGSKPSHTAIWNYLTGRVPSQ